VNWAISEHVEDAGVHSGDATMICPPDTVPPAVQSRLREIGSIIASALKISGPLNVQYLWKEDEVMVCLLLVLSFDINIACFVESLFFCYYYF
jgi:carbamoyl-phosphate synthase large subunit